MNDLIKAIETEFKRMGMTKRDFCDLIEEEPQTYNNWRTRGIPSNKRAKIARAMGWDFEALDDDRIEPAKKPAAPEQLAISGDGDSDIIAKIVEILIDAQNEMLADGTLMQPYDAKTLGKMARQTYINAQKTNALNISAIKEGIRLAAAFQG